MKTLVFFFKSCETVVLLFFLSLLFSLFHLKERLQVCVETMHERSGVIVSQRLLRPPLLFVLLAFVITVLIPPCAVHAAEPVKIRFLLSASFVPSLSFSQLALFLSFFLPCSNPPQSG